jgi:hypothetical protein
VTRKRRELAAARIDLEGMLYALRDNLGLADALVCAVEALIEQFPLEVSNEPGDDEDGHDGRRDRWNHLAHLVDATKIAVKAAKFAWNEIDLEISKRAAGR